MPPVIYMTMDDSDFKRKVRKLGALSDKVGLTVTYGAAKWGQDYIRSNMPQDTGASVNSIGCLITKNSKYLKQSTIRELYSPHQDKVWKKNGWFDLPWYMFDGEKALSQHWRSGNIRAVQNTVNVLRDKFEGELTISVERVIKNL